MKVLLILNHAPDYRESFLRELGKQVHLTVAAQPCEPDGLAPPDRRGDYQYVEISPFRCCGLLWQPGLRRLLRRSSWDVVCVGANLRNLSIIFLFLTNPGYRDKWVWWGHILGRSNAKALALLRNYMINKSAHCLVHSESIANQLKDKHGLNAVSFNNSEVRRIEFRPGRFTEHPELRLLFVGRHQPRKRLERLVELAVRRKDVHVRSIGPGMHKLAVPSDLSGSGRIEVFGRTVGEELAIHFDWADLVVNPGAVGLLVMNAARHGKGIAVDSTSDHGPESCLAIEAGQPFISFGDNDEVDQFIDGLHSNRSLLHQWGKTLQEKAMKEYTIEHMVEVHLEVFELVRNRQQISV